MKKSPNDKGEPIWRLLHTRGGRSCTSYGVHFLPDESGISRESHVVIFDINNETRSTLVAKLRQLADSIEVGKPASNQPIVEINASDFPPADPACDLLG